MQKKLTKIIATLGPSSFNENIIKEMIFLGVDCFRLNMSHGNYNGFAGIIKLIRKINDEVAIMVDLKGPKIRGKLINCNKFELKKNDLVKLTNKNQNLIKKNKVIFVDYIDLLKVNINTKIFFSDGIIEGIVIKKDEDFLTLKILNDSVLTDNKGIVIQSHNLNLPFISKKDYKDILFAINNNVDFIAASYVRSLDDVLELKKIIEDNNSNVGVISKIEHLAGLSEIFRIIDNSDAIMVARGDLGVEISFEQVPIIQKKIIEKCSLLAKPVIIATHILESMVLNLKPTRAEVGDISTLVLDGADALMLSAETAIGNYPIECIKTLINVTKIYEKQTKNIFDNLIYSKEKNICNDYFLDKNDSLKITHFLTKAAYDASNKLNPVFLIVPTNSGFSARMFSRFKSKFQIISLTNDIKALRKLKLSFGVETLFFDSKLFVNFDKFIKEFIKFSLEKEIIFKNDIIVVLSLNNKENKNTNYFQIFNAKDYI